MKKPNIFIYTTLCNPDMARDLLLKNGYNNVPKNYAEVARLLADYVSKNQEKGLNELLEIHPDLEAVKNYLKTKSVTGMKDPTGEFLYCAECPAQKKLSADAQPIASQPGVQAAISEKVTNALIIGGSVVLASIMVTVIITSAIHASKK